MTTFDTKINMSLLFAAIIKMGKSNIIDRKKKKIISRLTKILRIVLICWIVMKQITITEFERRRKIDVN